MLETILRAAGQKLLHTQSAIDCREKSESDFVTEVDLSVHAELGTQLASLVPGSRVISEEDAAPQAYGEGAVWIIDPVDGTSNLVYGLRHSCISAALVENGRALLGAVYNPYLHEYFSAEKGKGAFLNGRPIHVSAAGSLEKAFVGFEAGPASKHRSQRMLTAFSRCHARANGVRMLGSAALDLAYVACGRFTCAYFDYMYPWDYAAGTLLIAEAGGLLTDLEGKAPDFSGCSAFVASNRIVHHEMLESTRLPGI